MSSESKELLIKSSSSSVKPTLAHEKAEKIASSQTTSSLSLFRQFVPENSSLQPKNPMINLDTRRAEIEKDFKEKTKMMNQTIFWRISGEDLGLSNDKKPRDFIVYIVNGEFFYSISSEDLRPYKAGPFAQNCILLGTTAASLLSYAILGQGIVTKGLMSASSFSIVDKLKKLPAIPPIVLPILGTSIMYGLQQIFNQALSSNSSLPPAFNETLPLDGMTTPPINNSSDPSLQELGNGMTYLNFAMTTGLCLCALLFKFGGKGLALAGWSGLKTYLLPPPCSPTSYVGRFLNWMKRKSEAPKDPFQKIFEIDLKPLNGLDQSTLPRAKLRFYVFNSDVYYGLVINDKEFEKIKMAKKDVEDEDEDEEIKDDKEAKKKEKPLSSDTKEKLKESSPTQESSLPLVHEDGETISIELGQVKVKKDKGLGEEVKKMIKEGAIITGAGGATILSKYLFGEGLTTTVTNTIFIASIKAKLRLQPIGNGYALLSLATGVVFLVKLLSPDSFVGNLIFMPLSIMISKANKELKDIFISGKGLKNPSRFETPLWIQKLWQKITGWNPKPFEPKSLSYIDALETSKKKRVTIILDTNEMNPANNPHRLIEAEVEIRNKGLVGVYKNLSKEKLDKHLATLPDDQKALYLDQVTKAPKEADLEKVHKLATQIKKELKDLTKKMKNDFLHNLKTCSESVDTLIKKIKETSSEVTHSQSQEHLTKLLNYAENLKQKIDELGTNEEKSVASQTPLIEKTQQATVTIHEIENFIEKLGEKSKDLLKLSGQLLSKEEATLLHLATLKAKKLPKVWNYVFIASSVAATLLASWATKQYQLSTLAGSTTMQAEKLGEGVFTSMLNTVLATFMKKMGKEIPDWVRRYGFLALAVTAVMTERKLLDANVNLPFLFSGIFTTCLAIYGNEAKTWVLGKPYGKCEGKITKKWPSDQDISDYLTKIKNVVSNLVCCKQDTTRFERLPPEVIVIDAPDEQDDRVAQEMEHFVKKDENVVITIE